MLHLAELWQKKEKISCCFKNSTSVVLQQCQNQLSFQRNGFGVVLKLLLIISKGWKCSVHTKALTILL